MKTRVNLTGFTPDVSATTQYMITSEWAGVNANAHSLTHNKQTLIFLRRNILERCVCVCAHFFTAHKLLSTQTVASSSRKTSCVLGNDLSNTSMLCCMKYQKKFPSAYIAGRVFVCVIKVFYYVCVCVCVPARVCVWLSCKVNANE